jgi:hypothetical protein
MTLRVVMLPAVRGKTSIVTVANEIGFPVKVSVPLGRHGYLRAPCQKRLDATHSLWRATSSFHDTS